MNCHSEATEDDHHHHDHGHGHNHDHSHDDEAITGLSDSLFSKVHLDRVWCLNSSNSESVQKVFKPWDQRRDTEKFVETPDGDDPELLIHVPFTGMIKLKSIFIWGGPSVDPSPTRVRVFANRDDLDFESVGDAQPTQELELARGAVTEPLEYAVRQAKFSNVRCLTLHFPENFSDGDEPTRVYFLAFRGEWMDVKETPVVAIYELKPNAADHKTRAGDLMGHHSVS
ncbi:hypothetical protein GGI07_005732 [Coemansia sp. Benny D115]|nr:hypothetical protein GGI07_005732 [Coemansia sp. Benny D115]